MLFAESNYHVPTPIKNYKMPSKKSSEVNLLSSAEQKILERYISEHHNLATLSVALAKITGLRIGELCALQWKDIDLNQRILTVRKTLQRIQIADGNRKTKRIISDPKSESSCRRIPIPSCLLAFLHEFSDDPEIYVLSGKQKPVEPRTIEYRFQNILAKSDLPRVNFHALRHMFATECMKQEFDMKTLSELLGHSSVEVTMKVYVHSSLEQKAKYMDRLTMAV
jgi:integrase